MIVLCPRHGFTHGPDFRRRISEFLYPVENQYLSIAIRFSDPNFLRQINNLSSRRRFHAVTLKIGLNTVPTLTELEQSAAELMKI